MSETFKPKFGQLVEVRPRPLQEGKRPVKVVWPQKQKPGKRLSFMPERWIKVIVDIYVLQLYRQGDIEARPPSPKSGSGATGEPEKKKDDGKKAEKANEKPLPPPTPINAAKPKKDKGGTN